MSRIVPRAEAASCDVKLPTFSVLSKHHRSFFDPGKESDRILALGMINYPMMRMVSFLKLVLLARLGRVFQHDLYTCEYSFPPPPHSIASAVRYTRPGSIRDASRSSRVSDRQKGTVSSSRPSRDASPGLLKRLARSWPDRKMHQPPRYPHLQIDIATMHSASTVQEGPRIYLGNVIKRAESGQPYGYRHLTFSYSLNGEHAKSITSVGNCKSTRPFRS
ncbi:Myb-like DNA-binding protein myb-1 [Fusarium oxysporum f. sp. albedinis]|nr:Myb-like DNA-binding protein myb-1 [Fusarium oxysporum f. sp. albedinis]